MRVSKRPKEAIVRTFHPENLLKVSYHGTDNIPHLCIEVKEDYERCLTIARDTFHLVRVMRTNTGHDIIEAVVSASTPIEVASVYLAGYEMTDNSVMIELMNEINTDYSDDETKSDIKKFFEEVKIYLKEHEEF